MEVYAYLGEMGVFLILIYFLNTWNNTRIMKRKKRVIDKNERTIRKKRR